MGRATKDAKAAGLTDRQERFCREYLANGMNGQAAAVAVGYSVKRARVQASELLADRNISERIAELVAPINAKLDMSAEEMTHEAVLLARSRITQVVKFGPAGVSPLDSDTLSDEAIATVAEVSQTMSAEGGSIRVKQYDRLAALALLAKLKGLLRDKVEVTTPWSRQFEEMSDAELVAHVDAMRAARGEK